jgi:transcriptional regulator with XRE-family HTH domain
MDKEMRLKKYLQQRRQMEKAGNEGGLRRLEFGHHVWWLRTQHCRIKQEDVATQVGITRKQLSLIENGKSLPERDAVVGIADALKVDVNSLLKRAGYAVSPDLDEFDRDDVAREFFVALDESVSTADFILRTVTIWQKCRQEDFGISMNLGSHPLIL